MNRYLVEFLGTTFFIYIVAATGNPLAIGLALGLAMLLGGPISGGHYNPVVTLIMSASGNLPVNEVLPYVLSQIAGGLVALELYKRVRGV